MVTSSIQAAPSPGPVRAEWLAGVALVAGALLPLLKQSLLFGSAELVWPWQLAGLGIGLEARAALATVADGEHTLLWMALPLVIGVGALGFSHLSSRRTQGLAGAAAGGGLLTLLLVVLVAENAVLGLAFTPPTRGAGVLMLVGVVACAFLAAANHAAKTAPAHDLPRGLVASSATVVTVLTVFFLLGADNVWAAWPMRLVYLLVLAYAGLALRQALRPEDAEALADRSSTLARIILFWSPIAVVLAQRGTTDGFVTYVVEAGGGPLQTTIAALKGFLIFAGGALLLSAGLATVLETREPSPARVRSDGTGPWTPPNRKLRVPTAPRGKRGVGTGDPAEPSGVVAASNDKAATPVAPAGMVGTTAGRGTVVGMLLVLGLAGCTASPPADLSGAVASVAASVSPRQLERSAFYVAYPDGAPSDFVRFVFSPLGKAEWLPDDLSAVQGVALLDAERMLELGERPSARAVALVPDRPDGRLRHQVVLRADDARGVVVAAAYETWMAEPVLVREWKLPQVEVAEGVVDMARENLEAGVSADGE